MISWLEMSMSVDGPQPREEKMVTGAWVVVVEEEDGFERHFTR